VEVLARGLAVFFDPSPPSPLPSKGRGGIEGDFRPEAENFKAIGHGGGRATAAAGWTVESSQTEESTETATTVPLPGQSPQS